MRIHFLFSFLLTSIFAAGQLTCYEHINYPKPYLSESAQKIYEEKLAEAEKEYVKDSSNADAIIWLGRRKAYLGLYREAIDIFTKGMALHPDDARMYRHRGHRYITLRCFDKAIGDLKKAAQLVKGKKDEVEPDGLPNAKNIPTSTLQSNIWYHLGLVYFIKGDYKKAVKVFKNGLKVSLHPDMYVATANWMNIALREMNKYKEAIDLYKSINPESALIESEDYMKLLEMYQFKSIEIEIDAYAAMIADNNKTVASATVNFGIGYYCLLFGHQQKAKLYFEKAIATNQWASFGYIAAETILARMK